MIDTIVGKMAQVFQVLYSTKYSTEHTGYSIRYQGAVRNRM